MRNSWAVLRASADSDGTELRVVESGLSSREGAINDAKAMKLMEATKHGSWAASYFVASLEAV
jgi:hypothetical protein